VVWASHNEGTTPGGGRGCVNIHCFERSALVTLLAGGKDSRWGEFRIRAAVSFNMPMTTSLRGFAADASINLCSVGFAGRL